MFIIVFYLSVIFFSLFIIIFIWISRFLKSMNYLLFLNYKSSLIWWSLKFFSKSLWSMQGSHKRLENARSYTYSYWKREIFTKRSFLKHSQFSGTTSLKSSSSSNSDSSTISSELITVYLGILYSYILWRLKSKYSSKTISLSSLETSSERSEYPSLAWFISKSFWRTSNWSSWSSPWIMLIFTDSFLFF